MEKPSLQAPWRMDYIRSLGNSESTGCFLCAAAAASSEEERRQRLVLWSTEHSLVVMNRFPYTNGHLLITPRAHKADFEDLSDAEHLDMQQQIAEAIRLLKRTMSAQGFNLGTNLGRCAGAGLPGHLHQHIVPRWSGDTNFMSVIADVRVVPQAISQLYEELVRTRAEMKKQT